jgi:hypothetical protein
MVERMAAAEGTLGCSAPRTRISSWGAIGRRSSLTSRLTRWALKMRWTWVRVVGARLKRA